LRLAGTKVEELPILERPPPLCLSARGSDRARFSTGCDGVEWVSRERKSHVFRSSVAHQDAPCTSECGERFVSVKNPAYY